MGERLSPTADPLCLEHTLMPPPHSIKVLLGILALLAICAAWKGAISCGYGERTQAERREVGTFVLEQHSCWRNCLTCSCRWAQEGWEMRWVGGWGYEWTSHGTEDSRSGMELHTPIWLPQYNSPMFNASFQNCTFVHSDPLSLLPQQIVHILVQHVSSIMNQLQFAKS